MRVRITAVVAVSAFIFGSFSSQARTRAVRVRPPEGPCREVRGLPGVSRSTDGGQSFTSNAEPRAPWLWELAIFEDEPERLIAATNTAIYDSEDGGCNWTLRHTIAKELHHPLHISTASGGRAFIWSDEVLLRYDRSSVVEITPGDRVGSLGVNPSNNAHVRALGLFQGNVWESFDAGASWEIKGRSAGGTVLAAAWNPADFDHILAATNRGLVMTRNGGTEWTAAQSFSRTLCEIRFVRHSPNVVWAALSVQTGSDNIFRSTDGGSRFEPVARVTDAETGVCLPLVPQPFDANRAAVPFRTLRLIDAATRSITVSTCCEDVFRITYSPVDPNVVFVYAFRQ